MGILDSITGKKDEDGDKTRFIQNRKYRLCVEDNPDEKGYR
jgi:hypothetical protein